jgi:hypothetical protein
VGERLRRWLGHPAARWVAVALALVLSLPSLTSGLAMEDCLHATIARGHPPPPFAGAIPTNPIDLFAFAGHVPGSTPKLIDGGVFPWWTDPLVKLSFWRPISSVTHWIDWHAWPTTIWAMHLHSMFWWAVALLAVAAFYRRFSTAPWVGGLALFLYAIDDAHTPAVSWVANRNAMIALAIGVLALIAHDRWRKDGGRAWPGPVILFVGLLAGESALAAVAYLVAYAICLDRARWRDRALSLAPYGVAVVAWRLIYQALGYGTVGSAVYLDPGRDAHAFLHELPSRAAYLLASQFALPWADFAGFYEYLGPRAPRLMAQIAFATVALFALVFTPLCRRSATARFYALGTLLAVLPICSTLPADRLLFFTGLGAMGLIAEWLGQMPRKLPAILFAILLITIHVLLAVPFSWLRARTATTIRRPIERVSESLPKTNATMVLVNPPSDYLVGFLAMQRAWHHEPIPRLRWLATGSDTITIKRTDERTLEVRPEHGFLAHLAERMLRSAPFHVGETVTLSDLTVEVTALTPDGRPAAATMRFARPLEDYQLYEWHDLGFRPWTAPPVGATVTLPKIDFLKILFTPPEAP